MAEQQIDKVKVYEQKKSFSIWMWLLPLLLLLALGLWFLNRAPKAVPVASNQSLGSINFDTNQAALTTDSKNVLDRATDLMKQKPDMRLRIQGFTDATGDPAHNVALSNQRSDAVSQYLVAKGVDRSRLALEGFGQSNPVASNGTDHGKAENRRVELFQQ